MRALLIVSFETSENTFQLIHNEIYITTITKFQLVTKMK